MLIYRVRHGLRQLAIRFLGLLFGLCRVLRGLDWVSRAFYRLPFVEVLKGLFSFFSRVACYMGCYEGSLGAVES